MAKAKAKADDTKPRPLVVEAIMDESQAETMARVMTAPYLRHGFVANALAEKMVGKLPGEPRFDDYSRILKANAEATSKGELALVSEVLTAQALTLDAMFTEMARRATTNMGEYLDAMDRYARLALKAQANSRATLEALAKLHQPREQTVKHVHVNEGGQAVVADNFHQHRGEGENGKSVKQSVATGATGECAALPGSDSLRDGMPIPDRARAEAMPDARRD